MTLQPVLGEGIINAVGLDKKVKLKGSLAIVAQAARELLSPGFVSRPIEGYDGIMALDWLHSASPLITDLARSIGHGGSDAADLVERLRAYVALHERPPEWTHPTFRYAGI